jgi:hypothetical protein
VLGRLPTINLILLPSEAPIKVRPLESKTQRAALKSPHSEPPYEDEILQRLIQLQFRRKKKPLNGVFPIGNSMQTQKMHHIQ